MNDHSNITLHEKTPACCVTVDQIRSMTMQQRLAYYDALRLVESTVGGIICQPRYYWDNRQSLNPAGDMLDHLHTFLLESISALVMCSQIEEVSDPDEVEAQAWIVLRYEADCSENLPDFVAIAAKHSAALTEAEFYTRRGGRS